MNQVHDMMDDIAEQQDVAKEISEAISNPVAFGHDVDEVCDINRVSTGPPKVLFFTCRPSSFSHMVFQCLIFRFSKE